MGVHSPPVLNLPPSSCPTPALWVVPEHWLWVPFFMHRTCTGHVLQMVMCMFQCYSLKSSHPLLLRHSSNVCSLHQSLFCCLAYRVVITIFLTSIYMLLYTVLVFLCLTCFTMCNKLQFHPSHRNWLKCVLFYSWVIVHCVHVPQLPYPFICQWTSRLFPYPSCCKHCCNEH